MKRTPLFALSAAPLLIALAVLITGAPLPVSAQASGLDVVQTDAGLIAATRDSTATMHAYKMIPFAAPPLGDLRWKPPQPVTPWQGVRRADWFSPMCMQKESSKLAITWRIDEAMSEDCLYLNVWTPAKSASDKVPVMVWFYGGGNTAGSGSDVLYDGTALTKKGVIVVTFNYRVGIFGWLTHPDLTKESGSKTSGNYALLDMLAALKWVQKNIAAFGGDPNNVILFGESAGSHDIGLLTLSPLAKGLFQRAIAQSSGPMMGASPSGQVMVKLSDSEQTWANWAKKNFNASTIAELRNKSAWDIVKLTNAGTMVIDGYVLSDYAENIYAQGKQIDVPLLLGWNKDEGTTFAPMATKIVSYTVAAQTRYGKFADQFVKTYPATTDTEAVAQSRLSLRDMMGRGMWAWARAHALTGKTSTYLYHWTHTNTYVPNVKLMPGSPLKEPSELGAAHGSEIEWVFQNIDLFAAIRKYTDADYELSDTLASYWTNFAKTGNPNGPGLPTWPLFDDKSANPMMYLGDEVKPGPLPNKPGLDFHDAWASSLLPPKQ